MAYGPGVNEINYSDLPPTGDTVNSAFQKTQNQFDALYTGLNNDIVRASEAEVNTATDTTKLVTPGTLLKGKVNGVASLDALGKVTDTELPLASATVKGVAELATPEEVATGLDTSRVPTPAGLVGIRSNQNILHNWDFRNPVNQRGLTTLSVDTGYFIDRWKINASGTNCVASLISGGVSLTRPAPNYIGLRQFIENPAQYSGLTVTLSARIKGTGSFRIYADGVSYGYIAITDEAEYTLKQATFTFPTIASELYVHFSSGNGGTLYIQRVKLEIGKVSTLENDPPMDYGKELLTCQRFFYSSVSGGAPFMCRHRNLSDGALAAGYFSRFYFPVQMRIVPTVTVTYDIADATAVTAAALYPTTLGGTVDVSVPAGQSIDINKIVASADL